MIDGECNQVDSYGRQNILIGTHMPNYSGFSSTSLSLRIMRGTPFRESKCNLEYSLGMSKLSKSRSFQGKRFYISD